MPNRVLKESIKSSPQIDSLTWFEEVVFYRLIVSADDYGCFDGRAIFVKNALVPIKENVTKKAIEDAIRKLASVGLLCEYTVNGMPYLFFPTWEKHQRIRTKHRKYPGPSENDLAAIRGNLQQSAAICGELQQVAADCHPESESESESNPNPKERSTRARFTPPTVEEVAEYCRERGNGVDAERFVSFYAAKGWMIGKSPMKDWKAAVRTWERRDGNESGGKPAESRPKYGIIL